MTLGRAWQWVDAIWGARPIRFGDAFLVNLAWFALLVAAFAAINIVGAALFFVFGRLSPGYAPGAALLAMILGCLPLLPLFWIRASLRLNTVLSFAGLVVLFVIAFAGRNFVGTKLDDAGVATIAVIYLVLWIANRVDDWWTRRKGIET